MKRLSSVCFRGFSGSGDPIFRAWRSLDTRRRLCAEICRAMATRSVELQGRVANKRLHWGKRVKAIAAMTTATVALFCLLCCFWFIRTMILVLR